MTRKDKSVRAGVLGLVVAGAVAATTFGAVAQAQAQTQTLVFEGVIGDRSIHRVNVEEPYTELGFTFTPLEDGAIIDRADPEEPTMDGNTTEYLVTFPQNTITLTRADGGAFDLISLFVGPITDPENPGATTDVTIVGNYVGGGSTTTTLSALSTSQTATLNYTGLTSATFTSNQFLGMDNVVVKSVTASAAAPEPCSIALLLTAGVPIAGLVRRRKKN